MTTYVGYVWSCYGIVAAVLVLNVWLSRRSFNAELQSARRRRQINAGAVQADEAKVNS